MEKENILDKVKSALDVVYEKDHNLIKVKAQERSIAHKFAEHLTPLFSEFDIDCEYDRHGEIEKKLKGIRECSRRKKTEKILPDIVIHKRGYDTYNLVVFEIKSKTKPTTCDVMKLKLMTARPGEFGYKFGILIQFAQERSDCQIKMYINGNEA